MSITNNFESKYSEEQIESGLTPIGTVIHFMGTKAPNGYLFCDGTEYNIIDYPEFCDFLVDQFGAVNQFGGDGTTTFKVPDLRGEFLRGTGTNSHSNSGSGSAVGVHQTPTIHVDVGSQGNGFIQINYSRGLANQYSYNVDSRISRIGWSNSNQKASGANTNANMGEYTSRPTNTSVYLCIKVK